MGSTIYIADDEAVSRKTIKNFLEKDGFQVECFENGDLLYQAFQRKKCDLIVLDAIMPGTDGFIIGSKIRQISNLPIIMLTGQTSDENYVLGISLGFDVYLTKPINRAKLIAHVRILLARADDNRQPVLATPAEDPDVVTCADITISISKRSAHCGGQELKFTKIEFNLLVFILQNQDRVITKDELLTNVWGYEERVETRSVDDTVKRLRKKLAEANSRMSISTVWGVGFRVVVE